MADWLTLDPYSNWITGGNPYDNPRLNELRALAAEQNRINWENYQRQLQTRTAVPVGEPYSRTAVPVKGPYGPNYPARYKGRPYLPSGPRAYPVMETPKIYPAIESSRYLPTSAPSKFGWLKAGVKKLGPVGAVLTSWDLSRGAGDYLNDKTGASDYWLGDAGKADLSELAGRTEIPNQGNLYNGEISDDEFNSMSHADKLKWLADRRHYRENANYVPASPTATNEYGEGKLPDGTMIHDGVTVAPTVPTVDTLIATANKPRVANRVANRTPVAPTTPTPTFNYGGSAPTYASSYNLNRDPNYQYSEAYAWRNNPAPAPTTWNNGWAKPNPRASSITNYYAGIGY